MPRNHIKLASPLIATDGPRPPDGIYGFASGDRASAAQALRTAQGDARYRPSAALAAAREARRLGAVRA